MKRSFYDFYDWSEHESIKKGTFFRFPSWHALLPVYKGRCPFCLYPEPWSFERTPDKEKEKKDFPFTQEGLDAAIDWINQSYEAKRPFWEQKAKDRMKLLL